MSSLSISSLQDWEVVLSPPALKELVSQLGSLSLFDILERMKVPPATTICRVNLILASVEQVMQELAIHVTEWARTQGLDSHQVSISRHDILTDVVCVNILHTPVSLFQQNGPVPSSDLLPIFTKQNRLHHGWPVTHRVVICDRFCGEAVLRGSHIFRKGIMSADTGIQCKEQVAVYATMDATMTRGQLPHTLTTGTCIFLGMGTAACTRNEMFRETTGLGVTMSALHRVGPILPPLHGVLSTKLMLQNLPSVLVAHVLSPQPGETILDMCAAPGGKTSHLASLVGNHATIVACDKSRKKMVACRAFFQSFGATCITPLSLDSSHCVIRDASPRKTVQELLNYAEPSTKDSLLSIKAFYPESFDRILLDPPCSALGLRPKLKIDLFGDFTKYAIHQQNFINEAVELLKPGGYLTYSTCTINALENEDICAFILQKYTFMTLVPIEFDIGQPGLAGRGLTDEQCQYVRRFDPSNRELDVMGFFVAKFVKNVTSPHT